VALLIEGKKAVVAKVNAVAQDAVSVVAAEYRGLSANDMNELRSKSREAGVELHVVRNTLARRAIDGTDFACLSDSLTGPLFLAFAKEVPGAAARLIRSFAKDHDKLEVKALVVGGQLLDASQLKAVADLPTKEEAIAQLMSVMQAPISKFVRTLAEPNAKFVRTLAAVRDKRQAEG
jgi:large subunit ribosomal protein L10